MARKMEDIEAKGSVALYIAIRAIGARDCARATNGDSAALPTSAIRSSSRLIRSPCLIGVRSALAF
ncbi:MULTISPECIES: hypothetical protein [unclassified Bradyrhizobium]|uniref:hypothetical protein n=1 Tax=unclassified Bradyrhizobium TaxID=2631580 RepID=UPI000483619E|nr:MULTISPECIES: hypothetical protein [unclassified Bradyrhizobium]MCP3462677.1 hypothetical protein [Bradyrhizobium sp. CCGUVB23]